MSAHRLVTMQISPRAMTGCRECGASIIGPRGTATVPERARRARRAGHGSAPSSGGATAMEPLNVIDNLAGYSELITSRTRAPWSPRPRATSTRPALSPEGTLQ